MSPLSNQKGINEVINKSNQKRFLGKLLKCSAPGVFVSCRKWKFSFNKKEQELINFSYQTVTE